MKTIQVSDAAWQRLKLKAATGKKLYQIIDEWLGTGVMGTNGSDAVTAGLTSAPEGSVAPGRTTNESQAVRTGSSGLGQKNRRGAAGVPESSRTVGQTVTSAAVSTGSVVAPADPSRCGCGHLESLHRDGMRCQAVGCVCRLFHVEPRTETF